MELEQKTLSRPVSNKPDSKKLLKGLFDQKTDGLLCDVKLHLQGSIIWSHACVLASSSSYFMDYFQPNIKQLGWESHWCIRKPLIIDLGSIMRDIKDLCVICVSKIIDFMYLRELVVMKGHFQHFSQIAHFLRVFDLLPLCEKYCTETSSSVDTNSARKCNKDMKNRCEFLCCKNTTISSLNRNKKGKKRKLICETCSYSTVCVQKMLKHMESTSHFGTTCPVCNMCVTSTNDLKEHIKDHFNSKPYICHMCRKRSRFLEHHNNHLKVHCINKQFLCEICQKRFKRHQNLISHLMTHGKQYVCNKCDYITSDANVFKSHICKQEKISTDSLMEIRPEKHDEIGLNTNLQAIETVKGFHCQVCGQDFTQKKNLIRHTQLKHLGINQFNCSKCTYVTDRSDRLRHHMKIQHNYTLEEINDRIWREGKKKTRLKETKTGSNNVVGVLIPVQLVSTNDSSVLNAFPVNTSANRGLMVDQNTEGNINIVSSSNSELGHTPPADEAISAICSNHHSVKLCDRYKGKNDNLCEKINSLHTLSNKNEASLVLETDSLENIHETSVNNLQASLHADMSLLNSNSETKGHVNICPDTRELNNSHLTTDNQNCNTNRMTDNSVLEMNSDIWLNETTGELLSGNNFLNVHLIETRAEHNNSITESESSSLDPLQTLILNETANGLSVFDLADDTDDLQSNPQTPQTNIVEFDDPDNIFSWNCKDNNICSTWVLNEATGELNMVSFGMQPLNNSDELKLDKNNDNILSIDDDETALFLNEGTGDLSVIYFNPNKCEYNSPKKSNNEQLTQDTLETLSEHSNDEDDEKLLNEEFLMASASFIADEENDTFLDELTGEFNISNLNNYQSGDQVNQLKGNESIYLNEETGEISWNVMDQHVQNDLFANTELLNYDFDDSLNCEDFDTFHSDLSDMSSQFCLATNTSKEFSSVEENNDTLLNECTGELVKRS